MTTAARDLTTVPVSPRPDGTYGVLSSNGATIYTVRLSSEGNSCTCPAGTNGRNCYHVAAAIAQSTPPCVSERWQRQTDTMPPRPACYHCGSTAPDVAVYPNAWDNDAELALCPACIASPYAAAR